MRIGSDPEVFLTNGQDLIASCGLIGAGKHNPLQLDTMPDGFTLQEDNVTLEYGIPPASSAGELFASINSVMKESLKRLPGLNFSRLSCAIFPEEQMQDPAAHVFGCEPDFNAWVLPHEDSYVNPSPCPPHPFMRSAGGHIHVETAADPLSVIRALDLRLGVPSVLMDKGEDRKKLYGRAGAHRIKPYGVEYRTLSNFWIFNARLCKWVWDNTAAALDDLGFADDFGYEIQKAINDNDKKLAQDLVDAFGLEVV